MKGHLDDKIKQERADIIKQVSAEKFNIFMKENLDTTQEVLIEKRPDKKTGLLKGVTKNYINVLINNDIFNKSEYFNTLQYVKLTDLISDKCYGELQ